MKTTVTSLLLISSCLFSQPSYGQVAAPEDVESIEGIIKAYYEVVSGPAGQDRQWARDSTLHYPGAQVGIVGEDSLGNPILNKMSLAEFHEESQALVSSGFFEYEISRIVEERGALSQIWSTYEWKATIDGKVGGRGINSIQLFHDGTRYWILSWMFDGREVPIPSKYLPGE